MIKEEILSETRVFHYSDAGVRIRQVETGKIYDNAEDNIPCRFTYEETDELIEEEDPS